jgi:tricorn protease
MMALKPLLLSCFFLLTVWGREALLLRYPSYHQGRVAFSHMGDIWLADDTGHNLLRLTAHAGRDMYPRFSPDGKWVAFSSERNGNLDVFVVSSQGGQPRQLTFHSGDDNVLGWTPDGRHVLFSSIRGEDFLMKLYTGGRRWRRGAAGRTRRRVIRIVFAGRDEAGVQPQGAGVLAQVLPRVL